MLRDGSRERTGSVDLAIIERASGPKQGAVVRAIVRGPILGSMDSRHMLVSTACMPGGLRLIATASRSAGFAGAVGKDVLWRPVVIIDARMRSQTARFVSVWRITKGGAELHVAVTPPYPAYALPIVRDALIDTGGLAGPLVAKVRR